METTEEINARWRSLIFKRLAIITAIIFLTEFVIFFFDDQAGLLFLPIPLYLLRFLVIPSLINVAALVASYLCCKSSKPTEKQKDASICIFCFVLCAPLLAVLTSALFGNKRITGIVTLAGLIRRKQSEQLEALNESYRTRNELINSLSLDVLTKLYNRRSLFSKLEENAAEHRQMCLAILDIDNFKAVNDTYGHAKGDIVLLFLSDLIKKASSDRIMPARFGGEEFAVVFTETDDKEVVHTLEQLRLDFSSECFLLDGATEVSVTFSCGVVKYDETMNVNTFFSEADAAMYEAKKTGKNRIVYHL